MRKNGIVLAIVGLLVLLAAPAHAQSFYLNNTTLNGAITATQQTVTLTSASASAGSTVGAPVVGHGLYVADNPPEFMIITSVPTGTSTVYGVRRAANAGGIASAHATSAVVITGPPGNFYRTNPASNVCVAASSPKPYVNIMSGEVGQCLSSLWTWTSKKIITYNSVNPF